jgi:hypothetical protein
VLLFPNKSKVLETILDGSAQCAVCFLVMAIVTNLFVASDDNAILQLDDRKSLSSFTFNHWQNLPEENRWCTVLTQGRTMCAEYFGSQDPFVGSQAANSYIAFIDACAQETRLENELPVQIGNHGQSHPCSEECPVESFLAYFRSANAGSLLFLIPIFKVSRMKKFPCAFGLQSYISSASS